MPQPIFIALLLVGIFICGLLVAVLVMVRRGSALARQSLPTSSRQTGSQVNFGTTLDALDSCSSDAVHSGAATILRQPHLGSGSAESSPSEPDDPSIGQAAAPRDQSQATSVAADRAQMLQRASEHEAGIVRQQLGDRVADMQRREQALAEREQRLDTKARQLDQHAVQLAQREDDVASRRAELRDVAAERQKILERAANLTAVQARSELIADIEADAKRQAVLTTREIEREAKEEGEFRARGILTTVIQRLAAEQTAESVVSIVHLPGDDMKGRVIGREGRNIRAFEQITGVNLIIDDTPEAVLLSCFDPVRRETARLALEELVADGRIHPSRIEEVYERGRTEIDRVCRRAGEDAAVELGITDLHPELIFTLGQLRYRTSYGQNVLKHLIESAHAAALIADELGIDRVVCQRAAFLHDIGKALTHEAEGSHARVGAELARKYGESDDIVHAIEAHHNEVEPVTIEAIVTQAADAVSGGRPGARRESLESYIKRLEQLEEIASACEGVDRVFAMQAGREIRVMVQPQVVDDIQAQVMARDIVKQIEHELSYPGQIKVTVIRESRATEVAR